MRAGICCMRTAAADRPGRRERGSELGASGFTGQLFADGSIASGIVGPRVLTACKGYIAEGYGPEAVAMFAPTQ